MGMLKLMVVMGMALAGQEVRRVGRRLGFGLRDEVAFNGRIIQRPQRFRSHQHKEAFTAVADHLLNDRNDIMSLFSDKNLCTDSFHDFAAMAGLPVWHEVLNFFVAEGCLERCWALTFPDDQGLQVVPYWDPDGNEGQEASFRPAALTEEQKQTLLRRGSYAKYPLEGMGDGTWPIDRREQIGISEHNFELIYRRVHRGS